MAQQLITVQQAIDLHALIVRHGSPEAAAHDCTIALTAIAPYTDRRLSALRDLCRWIASRSNQAAVLDRLAAMAQAATGTPAQA
jgi:hypothetical protein